MTATSTETAKAERARLERVYNLLTWGMTLAAWFTIAVMAYESAVQHGLLP